MFQTKNLTLSLISLLVSIFLLSLPTITRAVDSFGTTIQTIDMYECWSGTQTCATIVTTSPDTAPCSGLDWRDTKEYVIQSDEKTYKDLLAAFLSSYHAISKISILGKGVCGAYGGEKIFGIRIGG